MRDKRKEGTLFDLVRMLFCGVLREKRERAARGQRRERRQREREEKRRTFI